MSWIDWVQAWESLQRVILIVGAYELGRWLWPKVGRKLFRPSKHASQNRDQGAEARRMQLIVFCAVNGVSFEWCQRQSLERLEQVAQLVERAKSQPDSPA